MRRNDSINDDLDGALGYPEPPASLDDVISELEAIRHNQEAAAERAKSLEFALGIMLLAIIALLYRLAYGAWF